MNIVTTKDEKMILTEYKDHLCSKLGLDREALKMDCTTIYGPSIEKTSIFVRIRLIVEDGDSESDVFDNLLYIMRTCDSYILDMYTNYGYKHVSCKNGKDNKNPFIPNKARKEQLEFVYDSLRDIVSQTRGEILIEIESTRGEVGCAKVSNVKYTVAD
jgi:hypothetical protein